MTGRHYWFLAVFEKMMAIDVTQPEDEESTGVRQIVPQKWTRTGTVPVSPSQATEDIVKDIVTQCKSAGDVPEDALLIHIDLLPGVLIPR